MTVSSSRKGRDVLIFVINYFGTTLCYSSALAPFFVPSTFLHGNLSPELTFAELYTASSSLSISDGTYTGKTDDLLCRFGFFVQAIVTGKG